MDIRESKAMSIILMEMLEEQISKIIEDEIGKGPSGNFQMIDLLVEFYLLLELSAERLGMELQ